ncbi:MAG: hypothetical protein ISR47_06445 [Rhodospirillales bacterium]|nr:hypothetical protein [Rhodospirillales bacterium]
MVERRPRRRRVISSMRFLRSSSSAELSGSIGGSGGGGDGDPNIPPMIFLLKKKRHVTAALDLDTIVPFAIVYLRLFFPVVKDFILFHCNMPEKLPRRKNRRRTKAQNS